MKAIFFDDQAPHAAIRWNCAPTRGTPLAVPLASATAIPSLLVKWEPFCRKDPITMLKRGDRGSSRVMRDQGALSLGYTGGLRLSERSGVVGCPSTSQKDGDPSTPVGADWR